MGQLFKIFFSFLYILTTISSSNLYYESDDIIQERLKYYKQKSKEIFNNKIDFDYTKDRGTYCIAKEYIQNRSLIIKIPKEYLICPFDKFPFKLELLESIVNYFKTFTIYNLYTNFFKNV